MKKLFLILILFFVSIGGKILLKKERNFNDFKSEYKEHSGAKNYWRQRTGTFDSDEKFIKSIKKARKQIARVPKRKTLGLDWKELGPDNIGGRTRAILIDNANPNLIFAGGVAGGLWFSTDAGLTWSQTEPGDLAEVLTVNCIEQDELGYIYYGTGEGVFYGDISEEAPGTRGYGSRGMGVFRSIEPHGTDFMHLESSWVGKETKTVSVNAINALYEELDSFSQSIINRKPIIVDAKKGIQTLEIAFEIQKKLNEN